MEDNDKENLLMPEADEDNESQTEEVNEEKRDDKVSEDVVDGDGLEPVQHYQPELLHGGRPKHEEPHVKKIKKRNHEKIEYILRVDLESLGINEDDFEDLQSLFEVVLDSLVSVELNHSFSCLIETETGS